MIYTFARVGAVLQMNVGDYFTQGRRGWVRLHYVAISRSRHEVHVYTNDRKELERALSRLALKPKALSLEQIRDYKMDYRQLGVAV
jgi:hypothetical protein